MGKNKTLTYVLTLPLNLEKYQGDVINKRLEISRNIYNALLGKVLKRYKQMLESKEYKNLQNELKEINEKHYDASKEKPNKEKQTIAKTRKELYKARDNIYKKWELTNYSLYSDVKPMYKHFKDNIGSLEAQAIADRVYKAIEKLLEGKKVWFKQKEQVNSIENKWNRSGLRYIKETSEIKWGSITIKISIKHNDIYAQTAIEDRLKYIRIVRRTIRGKYKYYLQMILEGTPPRKIDKETGKFKVSPGTGDVGIDIGTQTIAISSQDHVRLLELCPEIENIEREKRILLRKLDRQRRANNPSNYNGDGTIKKGIWINGKLTKLKWKSSNKYINTRNRLRELQRKQRVIRKQSHEILANYIISLGDRILVEKMNYKGLQRRAKETTINKNTGKINKKKRFGKSLANKAPSMLLEIIDRKLRYHNLELLKVNTHKVKASQYNHFTDECSKKQLEDRWNEEINIQRDLYSAFLIQNVDKALDKINRQLCIKRYDNFKKLHDREIERLKDLKKDGRVLITSMGI